MLNVKTIDNYAKFDGRGKTNDDGDNNSGNEQCAMFKAVETKYFSLVNQIEFSILDARLIILSIVKVLDIQQLKML